MSRDATGAAAACFIAMWLATLQTAQLLPSVKMCSTLLPYLGKKYLILFSSVATMHFRTYKFGIATSIT